jgi:acyl carrier protein
MSAVDVDAILREELANIAPDVELETIDPHANLREALDIDSMDFLNFVTAIHHRLVLDIPELDYPKLGTLAGALDYLTAKLAVQRASDSATRG